MSDFAICETGLWVDGEGRVVTSPPDGPGRQLVPPGGQMRPERVRAVETARAAAPPDPDAEPESDGVDGVDAAEPKPRRRRPSS